MVPWGCFCPSHRPDFASSRPLYEAAGQHPVSRLCCFPARSVHESALTVPSSSPSFVQTIAQVLPIFKTFTIWSWSWYRGCSVFLAPRDLQWRYSSLLFLSCVRWDLFDDQGPDLGPLRWECGAPPLGHQGSPSPASFAA